MDTETFSLERAANIAGIEPQLLRDWVADKTVVPAVPGGRGRGNAHRLSFMQIVGIVVAQVLRDTERGCALSYAKKVVGAFGAVSEQWLLDRFAKGATHLLLVHADRPLLERHRYDDQIDVRAAYEAVKEKVAKVSKQAVAN